MSYFMLFNLLINTLKKTSKRTACPGFFFSIQRENEAPTENNAFHYNFTFIINPEHNA